MRRIGFGLLGLIGLGVALVALFREPIALRLMERAVASSMATDSLAALPAGLHVVLCGAGSPLPDPDRAGPCTAVIAGERLFVVDAGAGASRNLARMRLPQGEIERVLLTHFHSDHIDGLGELLMQRWVNGARTEPVPVHGPQGVEAVVGGFGRAYAADAQYRTAHHGQALAPPSGAGAIAAPFGIPSAAGSVKLLDDGGLVIRAFRVDHDPVKPAVGYRFDYGGRSVVISGDTTKSARVERMAADADVLVHEALSPALVGVLTRAAEAAGRERIAKITRDILDYHTTPVEAAEIARDARVRHLLLTHIVPPLPVRPLEAIFLEGVDEVFDGPVTLGRDGVIVSLPAGADSVTVDTLDTLP